MFALCVCFACASFCVIGWSVVVCVLCVFVRVFLLMCFECVWVLSFGFGCLLVFWGVYGVCSNVFVVC